MKGNSLAQIRKKEIPMAKHPASRQRNIESDMRYTLSRSTMKGGDVIVENKVEHENGTNCNSSELEETNDNPALKERTKDVTFVSEEKSVAMKRKFKENIQDKSVSSDHNHSCKRFCKSGKEKSTELSLKDAADKSQLVVANGNGIKGALSQNVSGKSSDINSNKKSIELVLKKKVNNHNRTLFSRTQKIILKLSMLAQISTQENDGRLQGFPEKEIIEEYKNQTKQLLQMAKNGCCAKSQLGLKKGYFCKYLLGLFKVIDVFLNERLTLISKAMEGITESNKITLTENFKAILQNEWKIGSNQLETNSMIFMAWHKEALKHSPTFIDEAKLHISERNKLLENLKKIAGTFSASILLENKTSLLEIGQGELCNPAYVENAREGNRCSQCFIPALLVKGKVEVKAIVGFNNNKKLSWTQEEEDALIRGVKKFGEGNWIIILSSYKAIFHPFRTSTHLEDKWRNLKNKGLVSTIRKESWSRFDCRRNGESESFPRLIQRNTKGSKLDHGCLTRKKRP